MSRREQPHPPSGLTKLKKRNRYVRGDEQLGIASDILHNKLMIVSFHK